jgi:hypothetical protein
MSKFTTKTRDETADITTTCHEGFTESNARYILLARSNEVTSYARTEDTTHARSG